jgi:hypothetical protein
MFIDCCPIETLSTLWIKSGRFSQSDMGMSFEEVMVPLQVWLSPNDLLKLSKQSSFVEWVCDITSVSNPVGQGFFLSITKMLSGLLGCTGCIGTTMPIIAKSTMWNTKIFSSLRDISCMASSEVVKSILNILFCPSSPIDFALGHALNDMKHMTRN